MPETIADWLSATLERRARNGVARLGTISRERAVALWDRWNLAVEKGLARRGALRDPERLAPPGIRTQDEGHYVRFFYYLPAPNHSHMPGLRVPKGWKMLHFRGVEALLPSGFPWEDPVEETP